jgi:hypothetical protein
VIERVLRRDGDATALVAATIAVGETPPGQRERRGGPLVNGVVERGGSAARA